MEQKDYPYAILPVTCPDPETAKKLDPWSVQEFFRIEFLLRSNTVMELFRTQGTHPKSSAQLLWQYQIPWTVLDGAHHGYLTLRPGQVGPIPGMSILNFRDLYETLAILSQLLSTQSEDQKQQALQKFEQRFLCLLIGPTLPPALIQKALQPLLVERYKSVGKASFKKPKKFDVKTWLQYLACYDWRVTKGATYGVIAERIYQKKGARPRDRAEKAVDRVTKLIHAAEQHVWYPHTG